MRAASLYEITNTGRGIKQDLPRSMEEAQAFLAYAYAGQQVQMGQRMGMAVKGGDAGNVIDAFHRRDCQVPFNVPGLGMVDTGQPSGMRNNNQAFQQGLHIAMGNKPSTGGGGGQMGGMQNQRGGRMMGGGMRMGGMQGQGQGPGFAGGMQGQGRGMGGNVKTDPGVAQAKGTNCGDKVRQIDVGVMSKSGQMMTIRGLIDSGAGVALMDPAIGSMLGFGQSDSIRTIQAQGEQAMAQVPLINIMATFEPNPMPLPMQAALFADGQDSVFTPFPTCDITMRVTIDIDSKGHTLTAPNGMTVHYDCANNMKTMSMGGMAMAQAPTGMPMMQQMMQGRMQQMMQRMGGRMM